MYAEEYHVKGFKLSCLIFTEGVKNYRHTKYINYLQGATIKFLEWPCESEIYLPVH
jgi:hypothetical protein